MAKRNERRLYKPELAQLLKDKDVLESKALYGELARLLDLVIEFLSEYMLANDDFDKVKIGNYIEMRSILKDEVINEKGNNFSDGWRVPHRKKIQITSSHKLKKSKELTKEEYEELKKIKK